MAISHFDMDKCIRCGLCEKLCPVDVIRFDTEKNEPIIAYLADCMICGLCESRCPKMAIVITPERTVFPITAWQ